MEPIFLSITETPGVAAWPLVAAGASATSLLCLVLLLHATRLPRAPWAGTDSSAAPRRPGGLLVSGMYALAAFVAVLGVCRVTLSPTPGTPVTPGAVLLVVLTAALLVLLAVVAHRLLRGWGGTVTRYPSLLVVIGLVVSGCVALAGTVALTTGPGERQRYEVTGRVFDVHHQVIAGEDGRDMEHVVFRVSGTGDYQFVVGAGTIGKIRDGSDTPLLSCVPYQDGQHTFRNVLACAPAELGPSTTRPGYSHHRAVPVLLDRSLVSL